MSLSAALLPSLAAGAVRVLGLTLSVRAEGIEPVQALWSARRPVIYAVWHGRILLVPWLNRRFARTHGARAARVLASRSRDGELIARFVTRFGLSVVRGSSSQGGAEALRSLVAALRAGQDVAVVPDGPRGPARVLQPGVIVLAAASGAPIVPLGLAARPAVRLGSWDRFVVPLPFARCTVVFGKPLPVAGEADRETTRADVERALDEVTDTADRLVAS